MITTATPLVEIQATLRDLMPELKARYKVATLKLFGSFVRGEQHATSDLDVLVTFERVPDLWKYYELEDFLTDTLGIKVDLVTESGLKPRVRETILTELVVL